MVDIRDGRLDQLGKVKTRQLTIRNESAECDEGSGSIDLPGDAIGL